MAEWTLVQSRYLFYLFLLITDILNANILITQELKNKLLSGDIIFRKEDSFLSNRFEKLDGRGFSHIGVIYKKSNKVYVVHIEDDGSKNDLKVVSIDEFLKKATKIKVLRYRHKLLTKQMIQNIKSLIKKNPSFDLHFDSTSNDELYCTEMIYKLYEKTYGINLTNKLSKFGFYKFYSVGSILNSSYLYEIK